MFQGIFNDIEKYSQYNAKLKSMTQNNVLILNNIFMCWYVCVFVYVFISSATLNEGQEILYYINSTLFPNYCNIVNFIFLYFSIILKFLIINIYNYYILKKINSNLNNRILIE